MLNEVVISRGANPFLTKIEVYERDTLITTVRLARALGWRHAGGLGPLLLLVGWLWQAGRLASLLLWAGVLA